MDISGDISGGGPLKGWRCLDRGGLVCLRGRSVQDSRLLEPHSVSAVTSKVGEKFVPLRDLLLESDDERFVPIVADRHKVTTDCGFVLPIANKTDDPTELEQTTRLSVSTIDDKDDDDEWFETAKRASGPSTIGSSVSLATDSTHRR